MAAVMKAMYRLKRRENWASVELRAAMNAGRPPRRAKMKTAVKGINSKGSKTSNNKLSGRT
jgi:hypothetical protein